MEVENLFKRIPDMGEAEIFQVLFERNGLKIERIISNGQATAPGQWYDQDWDEWVVLLKGSAGILFEGDEAVTALGPGDYVFIPAHLKHRVEWTEADAETIWLAIHIETSEK
jgi:cupin 2 domain-containing protein